MQTRNRGHLRVVLIALIPLIVIVGTALAQSGAVRGRVLDEAGQPIEGVEIVLEYQDGQVREQKLSSNNSGAFVQVGLRSGNYLATFRMARYEPVAYEIKVSVGDPYSFGDVVMKKLPDGVLSSEEARELVAEVQQVFEKGIAQVESEDYQGALASFQEAIDAVPDFAEAHFNKGFVYMKVNEPDKALACYEKAAELRPDYFDAQVELGNLYNTKGQYAEAVVAFGKAIEVNPSDIRSLYNLGAAAMNAGDMPKAQEAFEKILEIEPDHSRANYQLGMVMVSLGKNEAAIPYLERYLELDPEGPHATTAKGVIDYLKNS